MKRNGIIFCLLFAVSALHAQPTLDECRRLAREHYPEIRQYDLIRQTTEYTLSNARRTYLPQIAFSAQATWQNRVPAFPEPLTQMLAGQGMAISGMNKDQYKAMLELNQTIWDGGKTRADRLIAEAESAESQRSADVDLYAVEGRVDDLYFGILLLDEQMEQIQLTLDLLHSNLDKMEAYLRSGVAM